jgi:hypothetical protein
MGVQFGHDWSGAQIASGATLFKAVWHAQQAAQLVHNTTAREQHYSLHCTSRHALPHAKAGTAILCMVCKLQCRSGLLRQDFTLACSIWRFRRFCILGMLSSSAACAVAAVRRVPLCA